MARGKGATTSATCDRLEMRRSKTTAKSRVQLFTTRIRRGIHCSPGCSKPLLLVLNVICFSSCRNLESRGNFELVKIGTPAPRPLLEQTQNSRVNEAEIKSPHHLSHPNYSYCLAQKNISLAGVCQERGCGCIAGVQSRLLFSAKPEQTEPSQSTRTTCWTVIETPIIKEWV